MDRNGLLNRDRGARSARRTRRGPRGRRSSYLDLGFDWLRRCRSPRPRPRCRRPTGTFPRRWWRRGKRARAADRVPSSRARRCPHGRRTSRADADGAASASAVRTRGSARSAAAATRANGCPASTRGASSVRACTASGG
jgi:hypothetical protein